MSIQNSNSEQIEIPNKLYFTIGEVSKLCSVPAHVLRYWEQEFDNLNPVRRRGQRRYYTRQEVELVINIIDLLYKKNFTINGARKQLKQNSESAPPREADDSNSRHVDLNNTITQLKQVLNTLNTD